MVMVLVLTHLSRSRLAGVTVLSCCLLPQPGCCLPLQTAVEVVEMRIDNIKAAPVQSSAAASGAAAPSTAAAAATEGTATEAAGCSAEEAAEAAGPSQQSKKPAIGEPLMSPDVLYFDFVYKQNTYSCTHSPSLVL